jgi:hypothetical protein
MADDFYSFLGLWPPFIDYPEFQTFVSFHYNCIVLFLWEKLETKERTSQKGQKCKI